MPDGPFEVVAEGLIVHVRLTPKAAHDRVAGVEVRDNGLSVFKARVRAVPENGRANSALLKLLSKDLSQPVGNLSLVAGHKSRIKRILITGDGRCLAKKIRKLLDQD